MSQLNTTLDYYNNNAQEFIERTFNTLVSENLTNFVKNLPSNARVLDAGCGSGRDSQHFLSLGFDVTAFDASEQLAKLASAKINHQVHTLTFEQIPWRQEFDGVWAMASLLHLPKSDMPKSLERCLLALKPNGTLFASFKSIGSSAVEQGVDEMGRFFSYYSANEIKEIFNSLGLCSDVQISEQRDLMGRDQNWLSITCKRAQYTPQVKKRASI